jgi:hypothetical protein
MCSMARKVTICKVTICKVTICKVTICKVTICKVTICSCEGRRTAAAGFGSCMRGFGSNLRGGVPLQMSLKQAPNPADSSSTGMNEEYTSNAMNANPQFPSQHVKQEVHRGDAQQALQGARSMSLDEQLRQLPSLGQLPDDVLLSNLDTLSTVDGSNELGTFSDIFSNPDPLLLQESTFVASSAGTIPSGAEQPFPCRTDTSSPTDAETVRQEQLRDYPMASSPAVGIRSGFDNNGLTSFPARDVHQGTHTHTHTHPSHKDCSDS